MSALQTYYSDYGSGNSSNSSSSWAPQDIWSPQQTQTSPDRPVARKSASYQDLVTGKCTLEDIMKEFQMNGQESPYTPVEDRAWSNHADGLSGMGPAGAYCRQGSWPAPAPAPRLPRPRSERLPSPPAPAPHWLPAPPAQDFSPQEFTTSTPVEEVNSGAEAVLSVEQARVLAGLPSSVVFALLKELETARGDLHHKRNKKYTECRFCKNNGERESYYRTHSLKNGSGVVTCPVLRAYVCQRCGATGDHAHTNKYCLLSTADERMKSTAMMRSVRMASGRRRHSSFVPASLSAPAVSDQYVMFGETPPSVISDTNLYNALTSPLDPLWAALEKKLTL